MKTHIMTINELRKIVRKMLSEEIAIDNNNTQTLSIHNQPVIFQFTNNSGIVDVYGETEDGELFMDVSKILPDNPLVNAAWVKAGGLEEQVADQLIFLEKTERTTQGGYNTYIMYFLVH